MLSEGSDEVVEEGFKNSVWKERSLNIIVLGLLTILSSSSSIRDLLVN